MNQYRCLNKECKYYYWLCFFPKGEPEGIQECHYCQKEHYLIPEEKEQASTFWDSFGG